MGVAEQIRSRLESAFAPTRLVVEDVSEAHRGHSGYREGGESHFDVAIAAPAFKEMSRIERHRAVHAAIGRDLVGQIHALSLDISAE
jgi:BolA protein